MSNQYKKCKEFFEILKKINRKTIEIQTFDDVKERHDGSLAANFRHSPQKIQEHISKNAGIFWPINPQKTTTKRRYECTTHFSGLGLDLDAVKEKDKSDKKLTKKWKQETLDKLENLAFPPSFIIETKNGIQPVWLFEPMALDSDDARKNAIQDYKQLIKSIGIKTGLTSEGDSICRVLRLPGSFHLKTPTEPFKIIFIKETGGLTDYKKFKDYFWTEPKPFKPTSYVWDSWSYDTNSIYQYPVIEALRKISGTELVNFEEFDFTPERNSKCNIIIDGRASGQWVDIGKNTIGAPPGGEASVNIVRWCQWYHPNVSDKKMREQLDQVLDGEKARLKYSSARVYALQQEKEEITLSELQEILSLTIKEDNENKVICFLCYLLAYTDSSQFNISFNAPSSSGKSYIALEVSKLFPKQDLLKLSYVSPTAFYHSEGEFDEDKDARIIDLERKILIFLDMPHTMLLEKLRSLLSHDEKEVKAKITDRNQRGQNRAKNVIIRGFSSVVFASANFVMDEQEQTRFLLLSPETSANKSEQALDETIRRLSDFSAYKDSNITEAKTALIKRIEDIRDSRIDEIRLHDKSKLTNYFKEKHGNAKPRHSRDITRLISIIKGWALLNLGNRTIVGKSILTADRDYEVAFSLWDKVSLPQEFGVSPYLLSVYIEVIWVSYKEKGSPLDRKEVQSAFFKTYDKPLPYRKLSAEFLPVLDAAGLISQAEKDGKKILIEPLVDLSEREHTPLRNNIIEAEEEHKTDEVNSLISQNSQLELLQKETRDIEDNRNKKPLPKLPNQLSDLNEKELRVLSSELYKWLGDCPPKFRTSKEFDKAMKTQREINLLRINQNDKNK